MVEGKREIFYLTYSCVIFIANNNNDDEYIVWVIVVCCVVGCLLLLVISVVVIARCFKRTIPLDLPLRSVHPTDHVTKSSFESHKDITASVEKDPEA
jgi:hypothetical protein